MSCLRTKKIKNPKLKPTGLDKPYISIPDGKCYECRKRKTNDYLVRSYFEYISKPHDCYFVTLDYDDEHVPYYQSPDLVNRKSLINDMINQGISISDEERSVLDDPGVMCFDHKHVSRFVHNLREYSDLPSFRYLCVPHLGDAFDRPHYHCIFFFDKGSTSPSQFFPLVHKYWRYGHHTDIRKVSKQKTPFGLISYVTRYAAQGNNYALLKKIYNLPYQFRAHIYSSVGFGAQCLDPSEFNSSRLIKEGIHFLPTPVITKDYLKNNHLVYIRKDDKSDILSPFAIPRYYELKLMFDSHWDSVEKKQSLTRNVDGIELSKIRHNANYVNYYNNFVNSRWYYITSDPVIQVIFNANFPDSPYNGLQWQDIVSDVLLDKEKFMEFLSYRDFLELYDRYQLPRFNPRYWKCIVPRPYYSVSHNFTYYVGRSQSEDSMYTFYSSDDIDLYIHATFIFDVWRFLHDYKIADYRDWQMAEDRKKAILEKCNTDINYFLYLKSKNFDFKSLNPSDYVPFNSSGGDFFLLESTVASYSRC